MSPSQPLSTLRRAPSVRLSSKTNRARRPKQSKLIDRRTVQEIGEPHYERFWYRRVQTRTCSWEGKKSSAKEIGKGEVRVGYTKPESVASR